MAFGVPCSVTSHPPQGRTINCRIIGALCATCEFFRAQGKRWFCASDPPAQLRQGPPTIWGSGEGGARGEGKGSPLTVTVRAACPWSEGGRVPSLGDRRDVFPWSSGGETCLMAGGRRLSDRRARGIARGPRLRAGDWARGRAKGWSEVKSKGNAREGEVRA